MSVNLFLFKVRLLLILKYLRGFPNKAFDLLQRSPMLSNHKNHELKVVQG